MEDQSRIKEILAGLAQEDEKQPGLWQRILMGIPQAISVGFSKDPAAALGEQIKDQLARQQLEKQRRQKLKELGATLEIEDILQRGKEKRELAGKKELATYESDIRHAEFLTSSAEQREQLRMKLDFDKSIEDIRHTKNLELATLQQESMKSLEEMKNTNDIARMKMATQLQQVVQVLPYLKPGEAAPIFDRVFDGKITQGDINAIQSAAKRGEREEFRQKYEIAVGPAREQAKMMMMRNTQAEVLEEIRKKSFNEEWMWVTDMKNGQRQLFQYKIEPMTNNVIVPPGYKFESKAQALDVYNHFLPLMEAFKGKDLNPTDNTKDQTKDQRIDTFIKELPISMTPDDKVRLLSNPATVAELQLTPDDIERTKAKLMSQGPTDDPTELAIREIDEEIRNLGTQTSTFGGGGFGDLALMSPEKRNLKAKLLDERYALQKKKQDEAQIRYLQDLLNQKEAELATARTEVKKTRLKNEIEAPKVGLKARLAYAKSQLGK